MEPKIFIDGREGTTGLQIYQRLGGRKDIRLLSIEESLRKDPRARKEKINEADIVFLCLPDQAAREAVGFLENENTRIIDASTAHRTDPAWVYGFPELSPQQRQAVSGARFVANPGCHATGFISIVAPLVKMGLLPVDYPLVCHSLTGYSGGGKSMIAEYEEPRKDRRLNSPREYGISLHHKHLPEMTYVTGISQSPVFCPIVADYYAGMATTVLLHNHLLGRGVTARSLHEALESYYGGEAFVKVLPFAGEGIIDRRGFIESNACVGTNRLEIIVSGHEEQTMIVSRFDNLGKGASGAAVQNMNLMLGLDQTAGLLDRLL